MAAWHWGSRQLDQRSEEILARFAENGLYVDCSEKLITGFPFRLGLHCNSVYAKQTARGDTLSTGEFRSAAQFYAPGRIVAELDGPARYEPAGGLPYVVEWSLMRASARASLQGLQAASVDGDDLRLLDGWATDAPPIASATDLKLFFRRAPQDPRDVDLAFSGEEVRIAGEYLPPLAISGDLQFEALAPYLEPGFELASHIRANGLSGVARKLSLAPATGGRIEIAGPFRIDSDGVFSGEIRLGAAQFNRLAPFLEALFPGQGDAIALTGDLLNGLGTEDGDLRYVTLTVERGELSVGLIVLGRIAPLL